MVDPGELSRADLLALVRAQVGEIATLRAANAEIPTLRAEAVTLQVANAGLAARLERVERLVSRNSGNSSMPPSKDAVPRVHRCAKMLETLTRAAPSVGFVHGTLKSAAPAMAGAVERLAFRRRVQPS